MQERCNSNANTLELRLSSTNPSIWCRIFINMSQTHRKIVWTWMHFSLISLYFSLHLDNFFVNQIIVCFQDHSVLKRMALNKASGLTYSSPYFLFVSHFAERRHYIMQHLSMMIALIIVVEMEHESRDTFHKWLFHHNSNPIEILVFSIQTLAKLFLWNFTHGMSKTLLLQAQQYVEIW